MSSPNPPAGERRFPDLYHDALRKVVMALAYVACADLVVTRAPAMTSFRLLARKPYSRLFCLRATPMLRP